jgi:nicotinamidase/pyrazinamidase
MRVLLIVDVQNDFLPTGALPVPEGDAVVPVINQLQPHFDLVIASQDWHPRDHGSFADNHPNTEPGQTITLDGLEQILWPVHCVQGTKGAAFAPGLDTLRIEAIIRKGMERKIDSYSVFFDNDHRKDTGLGGYLKARGTEQLYLCGLAEDVCVLFSALDARNLGFETYLVTDATRGVDLNKGDIDRARQQMHDAGVQFVESSEIAP